MHTHTLMFRSLLAALACAACSSASAQAKTPINGADDMPRFVYPVTASASALLTESDAEFAQFMQPVARDLDSLFANYAITDKATLRSLLMTQAQVHELEGQDQAALDDLKASRELEEKPSARLTSGLFARARLEAALQTHQHAGPQYIAAFKSLYTDAVNALPWDDVQDTIKEGYAFTRLTAKPAILGGIHTMLDPLVARSGNLDNPSAWQIIGVRNFLQFGLPLKQARAEVLQAYIAAHAVIKPDIWAARELTLTAQQKLMPVPVAIWDSGIDIKLYPGQIFNDKQGTASGHHGLAFSDDGAASTDWLHPLTPAERAEYPLMLSDIQGRQDIQNGIDSKQALQLEKERSESTVEELDRRNKLDLMLGHYVHGTHCAGIAARGNPFARLVVARFNDELPFLPFTPTTAWAMKMDHDFQQMSEFFRTRHVRVVNMSWGDDVSEFEEWLSRTGQGQDPAARKAKAQALYGIWRHAVETAIRNAPDTLFITAAGNSDSNASFLGDVPSSLSLPNLIAVGAVNQAGDETSFTSSGPTVLVHADGYNVDSFVPGGTRLKLSGTSMASPNVVNLAAKLIALDPTLTPGQVIKLIRDGADASADGRIHLINPQRSAQLLRDNETASSKKPSAGSLN